MSCHASPLHKAHTTKLIFVVKTNLICHATSRSFKRSVRWTYISCWSRGPTLTLSGCTDDGMRLGLMLAAPDYPGLRTDSGLAHRSARRRECFSKAVLNLSARSLIAAVPLVMDARYTMRSASLYSMRNSCTNKQMPSYVSVVHDSLT